MSRKVVGTITNNAVALFVGRALVMAASFVFIVYAAKRLGVAGFGRYALARMYFDLLLTVSVTGLSILMTREIARTPSLGSLYFGTAAPLGASLTVTIGSVLALVSPLMGYGPEVRSMLWLGCLALVPASVAVLSEAAFVAISKAQYVMVGTSSEALIYTLTGVTLLWLGYGGQSLFVALVATRGMLAVGYAMLFRRQFGQLPRPGSSAFTRQLCRDWSTFAGENWLANLKSSMPTIMLSLFYREAAVGLYAAASRILSLGSPFVASFTSAMFPYLSRLHGESGQALRRLGEESLKYMLVLTLPCVAIIAIFADWVIVTLFGEAYGGAVPVLRVVVWVFAFNVVNPFVSHILFARGEQGTSLRVSAVSAAASVALCLALVPRWGATGAAWGLLGSSALACCLFCLAAFRADTGRVLVMFGKTGVATASLALFLALWRHVHPAALVIGAPAIYLGLLMFLRVSSARQITEAFRGVSP